MMHKTKNVNTNARRHYLKLVSSNTTRTAIEQPEKSLLKSANSYEIRHLTVVMMNRLWIPQTSTIVGLLGVGKTQDNFDELTKWIAIQLNTKLPDGSTSDLHQLESNFKRAVDSYPKF